MKSETCLSSKGEPLGVYSSEEEAQQSACYQKGLRGIDLYPYQCKKCGLFHLAPAESKVNVIDSSCPCTDSDGKSKTLYATEEDAQKVAEKRMEEGAPRLYVYKCPHRDGYHLTHKNPHSEFLH